MSEYAITRDGERKEFEDEHEFQYMVDLLEENDVDFDTETPDDADEQDNKPNNDIGTTAEVVDTPEDIPEPSQLTSDPLDVISKNADQFTDTIKGKVTINRQGYAVLAERFGISVKAEPVMLASETDFEYAEFRAVATTDDGQEYTGFGSAHTKRDTNDSPYLLNELAETRAMKRATAWATGVGMTAVEELEGDA